MKNSVSYIFVIRLKLFGVKRSMNYFFKKWIVQTAEKKQVIIVLPCMGMISTELRIKLHRTYKQLLPACGLRVILKISSRMKNDFNVKDKIMLELRSLFVYKF